MLKIRDSKILLDLGDYSLEFQKIDESLICAQIVEGIAYLKFEGYGNAFQKTSITNGELKYFETKKNESSFDIILKDVENYKAQSILTKSFKIVIVLKDKYLYVYVINRNSNEVLDNIKCLCD